MRPANQQSLNRRPIALWSLLTGLTALALYVLTAARTITTRYGGVDGGELSAVALSGGVAHPPGSPAYLLLARLLLWLPGEPYARVGVLSALGGAGAVGVTALLTMLALQRQNRSAAATIAGGLIAGGTLMLSQRAWSQAIIVEVYAPNLLWLVISVLCVWRWYSGTRRRWLVGAALALTAGIGTHLTALAILPGALIVSMVDDEQAKPSARATLIGALVIGVAGGAALYGLLPIWARRGTLPNWGDTATIQGWWTHVSAAEYRYLVGVVPWSQRIARLGAAGRDLLAQPGAIGLIGALWWGLPNLWRHDRALLALSGGIAVASLLWAIGYGGADSMVYLLPWTWAWCLWSGLGVASALDAISGAWRGPGIALAVAAACAWPLLALAAPIDLRNETTERERIGGLLDRAPADALLLTGDDRDTFGVWYVQRALGRRADVLAIDGRLIDQAWYRRQIAALLGAGDDLCVTLRSINRPALRLDQRGVEPIDRVIVARAAGCR